MIYPTSQIISGFTINFKIYISWIRRKHKNTNFILFLQLKIGNKIQHKKQRPLVFLPSDEYSIFHNNLKEFQKKKKYKW